MSTPQGAEEFVCGCNKKFKSRDNLKSHQRRHCRLNRDEQQDQDDEGQCPLCDRKYATYMGMRQHMKLSHAEEYNKRLQGENRTTRKFWTEDEENALARAEAEHSGENVIDFLLTISTRSKDAIKKRRNTPGYMQKVRKYKAEYERKMQEMAELERQQNSPQHKRRQQETEIADILRREGELLEVINNIDEEKLSDASVELRRKLNSKDKVDVIDDFEHWCLSLILKYRKKKNPDKVRAQRSPVEVLREKVLDSSLSRRKRRPIEFKLAKIEYQQDRKAYAKRLIDGIRYHDDIKPDPADLRKVYEEVFGSPSQVDDEVIHDMYDKPIDVTVPINEDDITWALKSSKANTPGPDGLTLTDAKRIPVAELLLLFNIILYLEYIPRCMKSSRTVLIPKTTTELNLPKNWRPITISAILLRLCNKIIARRLSVIDLCDSQRGFTRIDGCFANFATVETIMKHHRQAAKPLCIVSLDLAKAFDMVSHASIQRAVKRLRIDAKGQRIIHENYRELTTNITCGGQDICTVPVNRGVKQGDPMSPILFNMVVDELLSQLQNTFTGVKVGQTKTSCLAYADDIILFANSVDDGQRMLNHCVEFFRKRGLMLNVSKCRSIVLQTVPGKKKLYVPTTSSFAIGNEPIPIISYGDVLRYLGQLFNTEGLTPCSGEELAKQLMRIRNAPLKPQQKYVIIKTHLIPRYIAVLQRPNVSQKVLKKIDRSIRSALKNILHLPSRCSNTVFYAPVKSGGLGIFEFARMIPLISLSRWQRLSECSQLLKETYNLSEPWVNRLKSLMQEGVETKESAHEIQEKNLRDSYSGGGIHQVQHHPACNSYIHRTPIYWSGEDFIKAIHLRFNLLPTQGIPSNKQHQGRNCRAGCFKIESLSHVLQNCPLTHWWRIQRHDHVVKRLANFAKKKGWTVQIEPHVRCTDGALKKPDLILEKDNEVIVSDVGINWESKTIPLSIQFHNKISIYSSNSFVNAMQAQYPEKRIFVLPLILGARGASCEENNMVLEKLKLSCSEVADLITTVIRGSCIIHKRFMQHVWREKPGQRRLRAAT